MGQAYKRRVGYPMEIDDKEQAECDYDYDVDLHDWAHVGDGVYTVRPSSTVMVPDDYLVPFDDYPDVIFTRS